MARDLDAIIREDIKRRNARRAEEDKLLGIASRPDTTPIDPDIDPYLFSRSIQGQPSNNMRQSKASESCWKRGLHMTRTVGTADKRGQTVKVTHADGRTEIKNVSEYKSQKTNIAGVKRVKAKPTTLTAVKQTRVMPIKASDPRFGVIGNVD